MYGDAGSHGPGVAQPVALEQRLEFVWYQGTKKMVEHLVILVIAPKEVDGSIVEGLVQQVFDFTIYWFILIIEDRLNLSGKI